MKHADTSSPVWEAPTWRGDTLLGPVPTAGGWSACRDATVGWPDAPAPSPAFSWGEVIGIGALLLLGIVAWVVREESKSWEGY